MWQTYWRCRLIANLGEGIEKSVMIKNLSRLISYKIWTNVKNQWPPTPQDIFSDNSMKNTNLNNLLRWIIDHNGSFMNNGFVKLSKAELIKVKKTCDDIMTLISTLRPALGQVLLSHKTYHKTGSNNILDDLHKLGHWISYTETCYNLYK